MTTEQDPVRKHTYNCNHEKKDILSCEHCQPVLRMIYTNTRLMNIRHIFMKMLKEIGPNYIDYVVDMSDEEEEIIQDLLKEAESQ